MKLNDIQKTILACFGGKSAIIKNSEIRNYLNTDEHTANMNIALLCHKGLLIKVRIGEHKLNLEKLNDL